MRRLEKCLFLADMISVFCSLRQWSFEAVELSKKLVLFEEINFRSHDKKK